MKRILTIFLTILFALTLVGCNKEEEITTTKDYVRANEWESAGAMYQRFLDENKEMPVVEMILKFEDTDGNKFEGHMRFILFRDLAPITVDNFISLTNKKFYDGLTIHRIVDSMLMQGGDPSKAAEKRDEALPIQGEFEQNEYYNNLKHTRGIISMARVEGKMDSASSQFFVVYDNFSTADSKYSAFGFLDEYVLTTDDRTKAKADGILYDYDALEKIVNLGTNSEAPTTTITIVSVREIK